ncbi:hypothetical protein HNI00_19445 [Thermoleptolyngbya oregonensis NK1-22]|uniref:Rho termination factor N-terminal domain-containing protein n=1 Tax=Thermoleptolyngbya oregonensis NK1-22 TaxID=2547457 RepID=A0AA96Y565_9CYAN|nr:hypothetical protein [Thermoleptolyngbya oregonensis]WOB45077.1 hypothetical protein HNI00_19445 [Thermoleptolyngbya oregonensis NK1-22]
MHLWRESFTLEHERGNSSYPPITSPYHILHHTTHYNTHYNTMADYHERRRLIRESLKIQPLSHGQVYTYTVGVRSQPEISPERYAELRWSLENHKSNLIPIVVRRTNSLGDEKEYEAIYGADWVKVAEEMGIEMLWAWVFDLSDEEVKATQAEFAMLLDTSPNTSLETSLDTSADNPASPLQAADAPEESAPMQPSSTPQPVGSASEGSVSEGSVSEGSVSEGLVSELMLETLTRSLSSMLDQTLNQTLDRKLDQTLSRLSSLAGAENGGGGAIALLENKLDLLERRLNHLTDAISNLAQSVESLKHRPAASRSTASSTNRKIVDLSELAARLKQFRQDPSSVPAAQLKADLHQKQVTKDCLLAWANELGIGVPKRITKAPLIDRLLTL